MNLRLHKNATTPIRRAYIQSSTLPVAALARELSVTEETIRHWKGLKSVEDASHAPHRLKTTLSPAQEQVVVGVRQTLRLPLDGLLVVTREFIHEKATRSGLFRLLRRCGISRLPVETAEERTPHVMTLNGGSAASRSDRRRQAVVRRTTRSVR